MSSTACSAPSGSRAAMSHISAPRPDACCWLQRDGAGSHRTTGVIWCALVAARTGIAPPDAERRVDDAITAANTAVQKARRSAVILGFASAVSLLAGAAAAWYASGAGGRHRDSVAPPLTWRWPQRALPREPVA